VKASRSRQPSLFDQPPPPAAPAPPVADETPPVTTAILANGDDIPALTAPSAELSPAVASGEKGKARDIIAAIRVLKQIERDRREATPAEKNALARFAGFGPVALSIFPDPATGRHKDEGWQALGEELKSLLSPQEYDSAKRTTFNAFYTSPLVIDAIHTAISRLGIPANATVLEPLCSQPHNGSCVALAVMWRRLSFSSVSVALPFLQAT
jgi:hypothetical protein